MLYKKIVYSIEKTVSNFKNLNLDLKLFFNIKTMNRNTFNKEPNFNEHESDEDEGIFS